MTPPRGAVESGTGPHPIDPDDFEVNPKKYSVYRVAQQFTPPDASLCDLGGCVDTKMAPILPSDTWRITHLVKTHYLIESDEYNDRQCHYLNDHHQNPAGGGVNIFGHCLQAYEYAIYVTLDGKTDGGWQILPGSQKIFSARETFLGPDDANAALWPTDFNFVAAK
jgi:hypothetical protein